MKARKKLHLIDHLVYPPNLTITLYFYNIVLSVEEEYVLTIK
jgi:hypothetical protein